MFRNTYFLFVAALITSWLMGSMMVDAEEKFLNARLKPVKLLRIIFLKKDKMVTLHTLVYMVIVIGASICFQILLFYWWSTGYTGDAMGIPIVVYLAVWTITGIISMINCYLDYRKKTRYMRRKNRYKF